MITDLNKFKDSDGFVIHFGGQLNHVDTYTFANALVAFTDAVREINSQINHGHSIELRLEDVGKGSFRGKVKGISKGLKGKLKWASEMAIIPIFITFLYDNYIDDDTFEIEVTDDYVIIENGGDKTIIPRSAYDAGRSLPNPERVHENINRAIDAIENDGNINSLGIAKNLEDEAPIANLPRDIWDRVREKRRLLDESQLDKVEDEEVTLNILKAVFTSKRRKWDFVWRGIKVSAFIDDAVFITDLMQRKYTVGNGDSIRCILSVKKEWLEGDNVWMNKEYSITKVLEYIPARKTGELF